MGKIVRFRCQSDSCLPVKQRSETDTRCPGMRAVDGLQQVYCVRVCCVSAGCALGQSRVLPWSGQT